MHETQEPVSYAHMSGGFRNLPQRVLTRATGAVTHVATREPVLALTFDDGPNPDATPALLEILARHRAKATFFMTGEHAAAHPELVEAVCRGGHALGNHTWDHPSLPLISASERRRQIRACAKVLPGGSDRLFRAPYGHLSAAAQLDVRLCGHRLIGWSAIIPDWQRLDAAALAAQALQAVWPGAILVMHDALMDFTQAEALDRRPTLEAVDRILTDMDDRYRFVTIPELLRCGSPVRSCERIPPDRDFLNQLQRLHGPPRRYSLPAALSH
jgi:peptidoglycan-N-acetylglucosamine deacetylase